MAVVVLIILPALYLATELLPADCWLNRALGSLSATCDEGDGAGDVAGPEA